MLNEKLINSAKVSTKKFMLICIGVIVGGVLQQVCLPLFLGSFGDKTKVTGPYFVILSCCILFNVFFWPIAIYRIKTGKITDEMRNYKKHHKLVFVGIFDALNGLLVVYSSALQRTPGALQAILGQATIPFTMILSKIFLSKKYVGSQYLGFVLTMLGVMVSMIPIFNNFEVGDFKFYWPLVFLLGGIPGVLMNIWEEDIFRDIAKFDNIYLLAWESLYQLLTVLALFWTDLIPGFGTSNSFDEWKTRVADGTICFFTPWAARSEKCYYCALTGMTFGAAYCLSYVYGASMIKYASANTTAIISAVSPAFAVYFWILFKNLNTWAGGDSYAKLDIICYTLGLPIIMIGVIVYRISEKNQVLEHLQMMEPDVLKAIERDEN